MYKPTEVGGGGGLREKEGGLGEKLQWGWVEGDMGLNEEGILSVCLIGQGKV